MMIVLLITMLIIRLMSSDHNVFDPTMIALLMLMFIYVRMHLHTHKVFAAAAEALSGNLSLGTI